MALTFEDDHKFIIFLAVEQKKQKISEINVGVDEAESLVPIILFI